MTDGTATQLQQGRRRIIERPRLTRLLDESQARIKMLVAPAGYGKTTLARQWTANMPRAWYRVSAAAVDVGSVARGLVGAAAEIVPGCAARLEERLRITKNADAEFGTLAELLVEDLAEWPEEAWLVLDDAQHVLEHEPTSSFISAVVRTSRVRTLLCTRHRPDWITARDLLYGNALEIGRNSLAMTHDEAAEVMRDTAATPGVVALADGWPAVVGLASLTPEPTLMSRVATGLPEALYDYLAEELYQALPADIQDSLCLIAVAGVRTRRLVELLFPPHGREKAVRDVVEGGWLTTGADGNLELHPLLEAFLRHKLDDEPPPETRKKATQVAQMLISERQWDEAFSVIERYGIDEALLPLLRAGLNDLLAAGRTATVRAWVEHAERRQVAGAERDLAAAELRFRDGRFHESEVFALAAADRLAPGDPWLSRALAAAGRAAHAATREHEALELYRRARKSARLESDRRVAALGELSAATDLELPEAAELLAEFTPTPEDVKGLVDHVMRAVSLDSRFGTPSDFREAHRVYQLLHLVEDPITRCSFRNMHGYALASNGDVDAASAVVRAQLDDADRYRLDFVVPYAHLIAALIENVSGHFDRVDELCASVERAGKKAGDDQLVTNARAIRVRSLVARGQFNDAVQLSMLPMGVVTPSTAGELIGSRAVALACHRSDARAITTAESARKMTSAAEARVLCAAAHAIVAMNRPDVNLFPLARAALATAVEQHCVECFIAAYRGYAQLAQVLLDSADTRETMLHVLSIAGDSDLFANRLPGVGGTWEDLSPRERDVLALVARGLSNREIAQHLFITEATVKVHLSHIFEKLSVSSRTAAALRVPHHAWLTPRPAREARKADLP